MNLPEFLTEQWMTRYERQARYDLTSTNVMPMHYSDLMGPEHFLDPLLDYGYIDGDPQLKQEILKLYESGRPENITTAIGCLHANELALRTLLEPGDHVIAFAPGYQQFYDLPREIGCEVSVLPYYENRGWKMDFQQLADALRPATRCIILNNPANPTGTLLNRKELEEIVRLARARGVWILCDEIYRTDEKEYPSISDLYEKGIATCSLSKRYGLPGLRLGWLKGPADFIQKVNFRRDYAMISSGPLLDELAKQALIKKNFILSKNNVIIDRNKNTLAAWIEKNPHFSIQMPEIGPVGFLAYDFDIPSARFCQQLLEQTGVFFVPGSCFGCENHVRIGLGGDPEKFAQGLKLTAKWTNQLL